MMEREKEIQEIAYQLWQAAGCPIGRDMDHYFAAEAIWQHMDVEEVKEEAGGHPEDFLTDLALSNRAA